MYKPEFLETHDEFVAYYCYIKNTQRKSLPKCFKKIGIMID